MVQARLNGFVPAGFQGSIPPFDARRPPPWLRAQFPPIEIRDARRLQEGAPSDADVLAENGFVLIDHHTAVEDWGGDVSSVYFAEIEQVIRERLLPGRRVEIQQPYRPIRRGRGTGTPQYGLGVHSDSPLTVELFARNVAAFVSPQAGKWWLDRYRSDDVAGFMSIDFWRTTNMAGPLRHMPLAVCAPNSLDREDIFPIVASGVGNQRMSNHLALRFNPKQQWYFYPRMTPDELLVFKLAEYWKDRPDAQPQCCFHAAFRDPETPPDAEERQSCEHRVGIMILKD